MTVTIRSPEQLLDEARAWALPQPRVVSAELKFDLKVGWTIAHRLLAQLEEEGLLSAEDNEGCRNVRAADGSLEQPTRLRRRSWEEVVLSWIEPALKRRAAQRHGQG